MNIQNKHFVREKKQNQKTRIPLKKPTKTKSYLLSKETRTQ